MLEIINNRRQFSSFNFFFFFVVVCYILSLVLYICMSKYQMNDKKILIKIFVYCLNF